MRIDARSACFLVQDASQVGQARRAAAVFAERFGLNEVAQGKVAILVTELANNLQKHAKEGVILVRRASDGEPRLEILAVDKGPGMADVNKCLRDGYSTIGTPGTGLGSVARLADRWDIFSMEASGTVLVAEVGSMVGGKRPTKLEIGAVTVPFAGETQCGDNWAHTWNSSVERIMVADGLGHGPAAAEAAEEAESIFRAKEGHPLPEVMQAMHNGLKKTRGASVALAELDTERGIVRYVGVGNISAAILDQGASRSLVSQNGTVGHTTRKIQEFQYPWPQGALLVMNSDGLTTRWELSKYPGANMRHPSVIAALLWRDFSRGRDDIAVVVARDKKAS